MPGATVQCPAGWAERVALGVVGDVVAGWVPVAGPELQNANALGCMHQPDDPGLVGPQEHLAERAQLLGRLAGGLHGSWT